MTLLQRLCAVRLSLWPAIRASLVGSLCLWGGGLSDRAIAAENLTLRWGLLSQTVSLDDLEAFAATGEVPPSLRLYRPLLTDNLQISLQSELAVDPVVGQVIVDEILHTPGGTSLRATLQALVPNLEATDLRVALAQVSDLEEPLTFIRVLRQLPQDTLEIDLGALLAWGAQFQLAQMESAALGKLLRQELAQEPTVQPPPSRLNPFSTGSAEVEQWELLLRDRQRNRNIPVDIYWSRDTHGPLVVISHGFGADRRFFAYLARHLASHGLTVVSVEHPGSNVTSLLSLPAVSAAKTDGPAGSRVLPATEFLDRPRDISYVLDRLEKLNSYSFSLRNRLDTENVTFIGHSLGGYTGLALAGAPLDLRLLDQTCAQLDPVKLSPADWLQCAALDLPVKYANLKDDRIRQLMVINPLTGLLFGQTGLNRVEVPTLMLAGTHDSVTPMATQQLGPFTQLAGPKYLVTAIGGSHLSVGDPENLNADLRYIPFMPALPDASSSNLRLFLQGLSLSFVMQQTASAKDYAGFLTADYAQAFSTADLPLGLNRTLPDPLLAWPRLQYQANHQRSQDLGYLSSLVQLESMLLRHQLQTLQRQMVAYLKTTPPAVTAVAWPPLPVRPPMQAQRPGSTPATP